MLDKQKIFNIVIVLVLFMSLFFNLKKSKEKFSETLDQTSLQAIQNMGTFSEQLLNSKSDFIIPTGTIIAFYGNTVPDGWALCDGSLYDGINSTPDLRNKFILGAGSGATYNSSGGNSAYTLTTANLPSHTHDVTEQFRRLETGAMASHSQYNNIMSATHKKRDDTGATLTQDRNTYFYDFVTDAAGSVNPTAIDLMPPYHVLRYIMKK